MPLRTGLLLGAPLLGLIAAMPASAVPSQADVSREINLVTQAATAVIADLQTRINSGKLEPAAVEAGSLRAAFADHFRKIANADYGQAPDPLLADIRTAFSEAVDTVTGSIATTC